MQEQVVFEQIVMEIVDGQLVVQEPEPSDSTNR